MEGRCYTPCYICRGTVSYRERRVHYVPWLNKSLRAFVYPLAFSAGPPHIFRIPAQPAQAFDLNRVYLCWLAVMVFPLPRPDTELIRRRLTRQTL